MEKQDEDGSGPDAVARLLRLLGEGDGTRIPTSLLGRLRRTATTAARAGAGALVGRLRGLGGPQEQVIEQLVLSLGELKGVAMKAGQVLSYVDASLPIEIRRQLEVLQTRSQPTPLAQIERILREDFGERADALLAGMSRKPVATASIGQVHRARLPDGKDAAVKVLHPGIVEAIRADFRAASTGKTLASALMSGANIDAVVAEAEARFSEECNYALERAHQKRFGAIYAQHPWIHIPAVYEAWCSPRVLTTQWRVGSHIDDFARTADEDRRNHAGRALYEFYIGTVFRHGLFNADPHPGNLLFQEDGSVVILDHGCVVELESPLRAGLAALSRAVRADDLAGMRAALTALGGRPPEREADMQVARTLLRGFFSPVLRAGPHRLPPGIGIDMRELVGNKRALMRLHLPGRLLFLFRIRFGLHAVLARVGADLDWRALESELADA
ncbi:MAG TPA: AarF/ABC1/UbiB kinase family protein [Myxococcaceae bacterium]|nr:AarF/ABC1/UbiB kinase family protein [Myxococcaceae bacterium]